MERSGRGWRGNGGAGCRSTEQSEQHQNYFPAGTTDGAVPPRNFSPLISDGMIIRGDISHESGTWLNVDFIAAARGEGRAARTARKFLGITKKALREGALGEVVN